MLPLPATVPEEALQL
jgi:hypothetical protein